MKNLDIFISSPGDVGEERKSARAVVERLQRVYASRLNVRAIFWEDLPLGADKSFQEGIDILLSERYNVEITIFILWSRLGQTIGPPLTRPDGSLYRSGTEREFEFMLDARKRFDNKRPVILAYARDDVDAFNAILDAKKSNETLLELLRQRELARQFVAESFHDEQGRNIRAFHTYTKPTSFASRLSVHLRNLIDEMYGEAEEGAAVWLESPYRGLLTFDLAHAPIYFGRENEASDVEILLRRRSATGRASVIVVGPSGSGKSSLARAGVADALINGGIDPDVKVWRYGIMLPTTATRGGLLGTLVDALSASDAMRELGDDGPAALEAFRKSLATDPAGALAMKFDTAARLAATAAGGNVMLLFLVDQMEELWLSREISAGEREDFLRALEAMAAHPRIWVLGTLRSDLYPTAMQSEGFVRLKRPAGESDERDGIFDLSPPEAAAIHNLIKKPAAMAGLRFERKSRSERSLDEVLLSDTAGHADALPLLEYVLDQLFARRTSEGFLTFDAYESLGRVEGALANRAAEIFDALPEEARDALPQILALLVTVDADDPRNTGLQQAPLSELTSTRGRKLLTESLRKAGFLITDQRDGVAVAKLAHEALLRRWDRISTWLADNRELLQIREHVCAAAADFARESALRGMAAEDLLLSPGLPLLRGERAMAAGVLSAAEIAFVKVSLEKQAAVLQHEAESQKRKRHNLQLIAAGFALAAVVLAWFMVKARRETEEVRRVLAQSDAERADRLFAENDPASAVWYLCRAVAAGSPPVQMTERLWFALAQRSWPLPVTPTIKLNADIDAITFDPSNSRFAVATRDGAVSIFSGTDGSLIGSPFTHPRRVRAIQFSPDGRYLLTACDDAIARLWDLRQPGAAPAGMSPHDSLVPAIAWSPNSQLFATGSWDKHVRVWNVLKPESAMFVVAMDDKVNTVEFDPCNPRRLLAVAKNVVRVWDVGVDKPLVDVSSPDGDFNGACFSTDGARVLSFTDQGDIRFAEIPGNLHWPEPPPFSDPCQDGVFSPSGDRFAVAAGKHVAVYTYANPPVTVWDHEFSGAVSRIKFTPDGTRLLISCDDGKVCVYDAYNERPVSEPLCEPGIPVGIDFQAAGNRILVGRSGRTTRIWSLAPPAPLPLAAFNQGSPPLLLKQLGNIQCIAESGSAIAFQPPADASPAQPVRSNFNAQLTAAAADPSGHTVAGTFDGALLLLENGRPRQFGKLDVSVSQIAFSSAGDFLAAGSEDGQIELFHWPAATQIPIPSLYTQKVAGLAFLEPGAKLVCVFWDHHIAIVDPGSPSATPAAWSMGADPQVTVTDLNHRYVLVLLNTGAAWLVTAPAGQPAQAVIAFNFGGSPNCAALSPDGCLSAIGTVTGSVSVWNLQTHQKICSFQCGNSSIDSLCFTNDGNWLAAGTEDDQACIYQASTGLPISGLMIHSSAVRQLVFAKGDTALVTAGYDGTILAWPFVQPTDIGRAEGIARRVMQTQPSGTPFTPASDVVPPPDLAAIRQFALSLEHLPAMEHEAALLNAYVGPR